MLQVKQRFRFFCSRCCTAGFSSITIPADPAPKDIGGIAGATAAAATDATGESPAPASGGWGRTRPTALCTAGDGDVDAADGGGEWGCRKGGNASTVMGDSEDEDSGVASGSCGEELVAGGAAGSVAVTAVAAAAAIVVPADAVEGGGGGCTCCGLLLLVVVVVVVVSEGLVVVAVVVVPMLLLLLQPPPVACVDDSSIADGFVRGSKGAEFTAGGRGERYASRRLVGRRMDGWSFKRPHFLEKWGYRWCT